MTKPPLSPLSKEAEENLSWWLSSEYPDHVNEELLKIKELHPEELQDAFYTRLHFGTAGLRGLEGLGPNRINEFTISFVSQALAEALFKEFHPDDLLVFVGYDTRINSRKYAEITARVLSANNIKVSLASEITATPFVSYACRKLNCSAAVMITASHNPKEYNGYKVYSSYGGQILPPLDTNIMETMEEISSPMEIRILPDLKNSYIVPMPTTLKKDYIEENTTLITTYFPYLENTTPASLKVVYTPLFGTGIVLLPDLLENFPGIELALVQEQSTPDGNFPLLPKPNPEEMEALSLGIETLKREHADLLVATDPDADRMRAVVQHNGEIHPLSGNQIAALILYSLGKSIIGKDLRFRESLVTAFSIVSSDLLSKISHHFGFECHRVLTGFKYIAGVMEECEKQGKRFLFGAEESYGYLLGNLVRDKDGIQAAALISRIAQELQLEGKTLIDLLKEIDAHFGYFRQVVFTLPFPETQEGRAQMAASMQKFRTQEKGAVQQKEIVTIKDFLEENGPLKSDMLLWKLKDSTRVLIRPSGTEPKIKIYLEAEAPSEEEALHLLHETKNFITQIQLA